MSPQPQQGGDSPGGSQDIRRIGGQPPPQKSDAGDLDQAITALRARMDEEFRITERLSSKARQVFALTAGFFAVIQTIAFGTFGRDTVNSTERATLLVIAIVAGASVAWVARRVTSSEELLDETDVSPDKIAEWTEKGRSDPEYVRTHLVSNLAVVARKRSDNNKVRAERYDEVENAARWALIITSVELIVAVVVRL